MRGERVQVTVLPKTPSMDIAATLQQHQCWTPQLTPGGSALSQTAAMRENHSSHAWLLRQVTSSGGLTTPNADSRAHCLAPLFITRNTLQHVCTPQHGRPVMHTPCCRSGGRAPAMTQHIKQPAAKYLHEAASSLTKATQARGHCLKHHSHHRHPRLHCSPHCCSG